MVWFLSYSEYLRWGFLKNVYLFILREIEIERDRERERERERETEHERGKGCQQKPNAGLDL